METLAYSTPWQAWAKKQDKAVKKARRRGATREEIQKLEWDDMDVQEAIDEEIARLQTSHLLSEIDKLLIPRPQFIHKEDSPETSTWIKSRLLGGFVLTLHTVIELRDAIRKERKERSEVFRLWLGSIAPIVLAITGLLGVVIGLLAALHVGQFERNNRPHPIDVGFARAIENAIFRE